MCGIAGIMMKGKTKPKTTALEKMAQALHHRGPDDQGILIKDQVGLVHTRLSIIDLNSGHQPLVDTAGNLLVVNGEIYNYVELRQELKGYPFKTASDCEPILPLYQKWGAQLTKHLRGMYGLALYDPTQKTLILSRDPFGIKPLYFFEHPDFFAFASEPQAFFAAELLTPEIDPEVRSEAFQLRYTLRSSPIFKNIQRVNPGETLIVRNGQIVDRFILNHLPEAVNASVTLPEALKNLETALENSVGVHLRSDVPYGLFLSGGLDSATVLAMMKRHTDTPIRTYTVGFSGTKVHDEREQAKRLAQYFGTHHTEIDFSEQDFWKILPKVASAVDDLQLDMASLPTFKLAEMARQDVKVVLCGEGGDELLAGYGRYRKTWLPRWLGGRITKVSGTFDKIKYRGKIDDHWKSVLMNFEKEYSSRGFTKMQVAQSIDCATWLANGLMIKLDRCLMAHGVEGRTPFLDPIVAAHTFSLPDKLKATKGHGKWLLRHWLEKNLPIAEPFAKKRGFTVPVGEWIAEKATRVGPFVARQPGVQEVFAPEDVKAIFMSKDKHAQFAAWTLLFYAIWHQIHILRKPVVADTLTLLSL